MALINFKDINFNKSLNNTNKIIEFNGSIIEVVPYLSVNDKYDLIMITLQKANEEGVYNCFKIDTFFNLHVIYTYTNIVFSDEDRQDEAGLYDTLKQSGLMDAVLSQIDKNELEYLKKCIYDLVALIMKYRNTFGTVLANFLEMLPKNMEKAKVAIDEMDMNKLGQLAKMFGVDLSKIKNLNIQETIEKIAKKEENIEE